MRNENHIPILLSLLLFLMALLSPLFQVSSTHAIVQKAPPTIVPDDKYGSGGTLETTSDSKYRLVNEVWRNKERKIEVTHAFEYDHKDSQEPPRTIEMWIFKKNEVTVAAFSFDKNHQTFSRYPMGLYPANKAKVEKWIKEIEDQFAMDGTIATPYLGDSKNETPKQEPKTEVPKEEPKKETPKEEPRPEIEPPKLPPFEKLENPKNTQESTKPEPSPTPVTNTRPGSTALPGYKIETKTGSGLYTVSFSTPQGRINVNLTDDITIGDTISGTIEEEPAGTTTSEYPQNQAELNGYVIEISQQQTSVSEQRFTRTIPNALTPANRIIRLWHRGREVAKTEIPISAEPQQTPTAFRIPTGGQKGKLIEIKGPCDGLFHPADTVKIGETNVPVLAESPRKKIARNTSEVIGPTTIECDESGQVTECPFRNLSVKLSSEKLALLKGESSILQLLVLGLAGIEQDVPLDLTNNSPEVVSMNGGESQHITIKALEVREPGRYVMQRTLTGIKRGSFQLGALVRWSNVCVQTVIATVPGDRLVLPKKPRRIQKPRLPVITLSYNPVHEIFTGKCDGKEVLITVPNSSFSDLVLPKNVGTCPVEIYGLDKQGSEVPESRMRLEPGEQIGSYGAGSNAMRVVFVCPETTGGTCRLEVEHTTNEGRDTLINYTVPRGVIEGDCDGQENVIVEAKAGEDLDVRVFRWIKNVGSCPVALYSVNAQAQEREEPIILQPQQKIQEYAVPLDLQNPSQKIVFRCNDDAQGSCKIELDSSRAKAFPLPGDVVEQRRTVSRIIEGKCDGDETVVSAVNGSVGSLEGLKNVGTCPLTLSCLDADGEVMRDKNDVIIKPVTIQPNGKLVEYPIPYGTWTVIMECKKEASQGKCALQINEREIVYTTPRTTDQFQSQKPPESPRVSIKDDCLGGEVGDPINLAWLKHNPTTIKWIQNTGTCPVFIYSVTNSDDELSNDKVRLEPGEEIESYHPGTYMNRFQLPEYSERIVFSCNGKKNAPKGICRIEYSSP